MHSWAALPVLEFFVGLCVNLCRALYQCLHACVLHASSMATHIFPGGMCAFKAAAHACGGKAAACLGFCLARGPLQQGHSVSIALGNTCQLGASALPLPLSPLVTLLAYAAGQGCSMHQVCRVTRMC
jgi:hypothetical protein